MNAPERASAVRTIARPPLTKSKRSLSLGFLFVSAAYVVWQYFGGPQAAAIDSVASSQTTPAPLTPGQSYKAASEALLQTLSALPAASPASNPPQAKTPAPAMQPPPAPRQIGGLYADGSYAGSPADAYYGTVQVKAVVQNGRIADVQFLQYPSDRSTSRYINGQAMPLLTQEAIRAQSAQVDGVSGATFTSQAFAESLAAALAQAKK